MKKLNRKFILALAVSLTVVFFNSCKENTPPGLDLGAVLAADSSYIASVESKQDKVVLIEELTGVQCANCPKAARNIKKISDANPGRILAVAMHPPSSGWTIPKQGKSKYDFRQDAVDEIVTLLEGGTGQLPIAALNREKTNSGEIFDENRGAWINRITPWLSQLTDLNVHLESNYTADNNTVELLVRVAFTENITQDLFVTAYVIENDIEDYQDDSTVDVIYYKHQHVFRKILTSVSGSSLNFADKKVGTVLQKRISFEPTITGDNAWNLDNCQIIAFVHKSGADLSVLHAQEISLK